MSKPEDLAHFPDLDEVIDSYSNGDFMDNRDFHSAVTMQFGELVHDGLVDWNDPMWMWDAYSDEQRARLNAKIERHFWYREIGSLPLKRWNNEFMRKINEIMPKYNILYDLLAGDPDWLLAYHAWGTHNQDVTEEGTKDTATTHVNDTTTATDETVDGTTRTDTTNDSRTDVTTHDESTRTWTEEGRETQDKDEWGKSRDMESKFPQTLLSGNSDYASDGTDSEHETLEHNVTEYAKEGGEETESDGTRMETVHATGAEEGTSQTVTDRDVAGHEAGSGTEAEQRRDTSDLDYEYEDFREGDYLDKYNDVMERWVDVDLQIINELDTLFSHLLTVNFNWF